MRLTELSVRNFRNLRRARIHLGAAVTVIFGENGQGKTNLLDAIYTVATLRPLRARKLREQITFEEQEAWLEAVVEEVVTRRLQLRIERSRRQARLDGKAPPSVEAWSEVLKIVAFTPEDLEIAKGGPALRRRYLDRAAFTRQVGYLEDHRAYARALKARNRLLKSGAEDAALVAYERALARFGARLLARRLRLVEELAPRVAARFRSITGIDGSLDVHYASSVSLPDGRPDVTDIERTLQSAFEERREVDRQRRYTTAGPHADDLKLCLDGTELRGYASQGQQRAAVLALKVAEIENLEAALGRVPLLLLDDVSSELDPERNRHLLAYLARFPGQVVLTTTDPAHAPLPEGVAEVEWLAVRAGEVEPSPRVRPLAGNIS